MIFYDPKDTSCFQIGWSQNPTLDLPYFAQGYYRSAKKLSRDLLADNRFPDYEAYPVIFLYRHSLELYLKAIILQLNFILSLEDIKIDIKLNHDLTKLFEKVKDGVHKFCPGDIFFNNIEYDIELVIENFQQIDQYSFSFRYPMDKKITPYKEQTISLRTFKNILDKILKNLDDYLSALSSEADVRSEYFMP